MKGLFDAKDAADAEKERVKSGKRVRYFPAVAAIAIIFTVLQLVGLFEKTDSQKT